jgi:hypothetical protein
LLAVMFRRKRRMRSAHYFRCRIGGADANSAQ